MTSQFKDTTNTAFSVSFSGNTLKFTFAAPLNSVYYINSDLLYIYQCPSNGAWVDLGEFDQGIFTVNWSLCTSPTAANRDAWVTALLALIPSSSGSNVINSLAASARGNEVVGWNSTTKQLTDLGPAGNQTVNVQKTSAQNFPGGAGAATICLFNVVLDDPSGWYTTTDGTIRITYTGYYIFGYNLVYAGSSGVFAYFLVNGVQYGFSASGNGPLNNTYGAYLSSGSEVKVMIYGAAVGSQIATASPNTFWLKRIVI